MTANSVEWIKVEEYHSPKKRAKNVAVFFYSQSKQLSPISQSQNWYPRASLAWKTVSCVVFSDTQMQTCTGRTSTQTNCVLFLPLKCSERGKKKATRQYYTYIQVGRMVYFHPVQNKLKATTTQYHLCVRRIAHYKFAIELHGSINCVASCSNLLKRRLTFVHSPFSFRSFTLLAQKGLLFPSFLLPYHCTTYGIRMLLIHSIAYVCPFRGFVVW